MDQNIQKALWLGVGILFFGAVVSIGLFMFGKGQSIAEASGQQLDVMAKQLGDIEYAGFDNEVVRGGDVINKIEQLKGNGGEVVVVVVTNSGTTTYISTGSVTGTAMTGTLTKKTKAQNDSDIKLAKDVNSTQYINNSGKFYAQIIYDTNEAARGILFIQQ